MCHINVLHHRKAGGDGGFVVLDTTMAQTQDLAHRQALYHQTIAHGAQSNFLHEFLIKYVSAVNNAYILCVELADTHNTSSFSFLHSFLSTVSPSLPSQHF